MIIDLLLFFVTQQIALSFSLYLIIDRMSTISRERKDLTPVFLLL
jgi:hypothetical protein